MRGRNTSLSALLVAAGLLLTVIVWIVLAPTQFGGQATYVIINGNSMEPGLHAGDLVVLRQADSFAIGDIVTYRHPDVGTVIHRIIAQRGDRYIFQGDNNAWVDSYEPTQSELIGKYWVFMPGAGAVLENLRNPWLMALFAAVIGIAIVTPVSAGQIHRVRQRRRSATAQKERAVNSNSRSDTDILLLLTVLALTSALVALYAFTRSTTQIVPVESFYTQRGSFRYTADAPPGLYSNDTAQTGEPIFRKVINRVEIGFDYLFEAAELGEMAGAASMEALLISESGWQRRLPLQEENTFQGNGVSLHAVLDLDEIQRLIDSVQLQTGVTSSRHELRIVPHISISGLLGGENVQDSFAPVLVFALDPFQLSLAQTNDSDQLEPVQEGRTLRQAESPSLLRFLAFSVSIEALRLFSILGALLASLGVALAVWLVRQRRRRPAIEYIRERYGPLIVTVQNSSLGAEGAAVYLTNIEDLAKIAERTGRMILCEELQAVWRLSVYDEAVVYRFEVHRHGAADGAPKEE
ncbi:MAG: signal peptidase I [Chloroflexi bacterium]|nr:MAG: signal peptidase I [Chloroflexota bacterium]